MPAPPASLSKACCQWGHQLGTPWRPPTPPRTFKPSGPGVRLPSTTERESAALYVHIAVATQVPVILTWTQYSVTWAGQELRTPKRTQPSPPRLTVPPPWKQPAQSHPDLLPSASTSGLAQLWRAKQKPSGTQPGSEWGSLAPPCNCHTETPRTGQPGCLSWAHPYILTTNKSDHETSAGLG